MFSIRGIRRATTVVAAATLMLGLSGSRAWAQAAAEPPDPNPGALTITGNIDFLNQYMFRGIRQNSTGMAIWPSFDLGIQTYSGEGGFKSATINIGTWNSLHTGDTGQDGPTGKLWYESDFYATLGLGFGGGFSFGTTYTAYTSPNSTFSTVKEIMFKLGVDDSAQLGKFSMKPYAIFAFEFDTEAGTGQADAGENAGKYLELGIAPGYTGYSRAAIAFPIKLGMSMGDYYELDGEDNKFGYFSIGGIVTVPLGGTGKFGAWNLHFGAEYQKLGDTTAFYNSDDDGDPQHNQFIGSVGFGFSY
jgi:uncharacterized protein (TIGR02001 family)